jgi:hypothetical protein
MACAHTSRRCGRRPEHANDLCTRHQALRLDPVQSSTGNDPASSEACCDATQNPSTPAQVRSNRPARPQRILASALALRQEEASHGQDFTVAHTARIDGTHPGKSFALDQRRNF